MREGSIRPGYVGSAAVAIVGGFVLAIVAIVALQDLVPIWLLLPAAFLGWAAICLWFARWERRASGAAAQPWVRPFLRYWVVYAAMFSVANLISMGLPSGDGLGATVALLPVDVALGAVIAALRMQTPPNKSAA